MKTKIMIILAIALVVSGCAREPAETEEGGVRVFGSGADMTLYNVTMPDGRKCVAGVGIYKGAVSCDWSHE